MTDEQRNSFENLIFLCHVHHQTIDQPGGGVKYPAETLKQWKSTRETKGSQALRGLRHLTEDRLQEMLSEAIQERDDEIKQTLKRLEKTDADAAALIRELREETQASRYGNPLFNSDSIELLHDAASRLGNLADAANSLRSASENLRNLEDKANTLAYAASQTQGLEVRAEHLHNAAREINRAADRLEGFR
ncbi:hypothetical protein [Amycolatopsis keratiniphila]|uniref:hypothetical protein n=1 Tax=Amycolatopsis keratiniphila TaxID=129921 RepID=UPI000F4FEF9B|nr:hypothetical protein [Amycolatopsis keratiniphila]